MKISTYLLTSALCLLLPALSNAQSKTARNSQLSSKALAVATPKAKANKSVAQPVAAIIVEPEIITRVFTGTVLGAWNDPLAGAIITVISDPKEGGITNSSGGYMIKSTSTSLSLRVTYAGYQDALVEVNDTSPLLVQMTPIDHYERQVKKNLKAAEKAYRKP
ncbi:carboxypeptidase-like regulatory domain-containing protein [Hymenobacter radiodurans]|uniref:carboxypeptidase-like regulatory domain-containing protein n=1 Tax=Hymenobacter radiodurans TaxID=2496028 RepID=UPI001058EE23|nr:carboxypeptidase-like regulatory domain-containing protein [Hymenobacter radiodurans]